MPAPTTPRSHTWSPFGGARSREGEIPRDLLEKAVGRLRLLSAMGAVLATGSTLMLTTTGLLGIGGVFDRPIFAVAGIAVMSVIVFFTTRTQLLPERQLQIGLVYLVLVCFAIGIFRHWLPYGPDDIIRGPSLILPITLLFAVLIPVPPRGMFLAGLVAAAMDPLAMLVMTQLGRPHPTLAIQVFLFGPGFAGALLAYIVSRVIYSLGRSVREARELGSYRLVERIGEGGMGEVWRAEHRLLARPAAVKLVRPERLGVDDLDKANAVLARFEREAQATATLESHHTIALYDFGIASDGTFYYVMELLGGMNLERMVVMHGALPPERAVYLLLQVCHSLHDAHEAGVIHRDVKPANIYVCKKGPEHDYVKVLDFGLVQIHQPTSPTLEAFTETDLAGTPGYVAPEVILGKTVPDHRTDIYAVGAVAFWLVTGRSVFPGTSPMEVLANHVSSEPPLASAVARQPIPPELDTTISTCLAKHPDDRPGTVEELAEMLRGTGLAEKWNNRRAAEWWRGHGAEAGEDLSRGTTEVNPRIFLADTLPASPRQFEDED